MKKKELMATIAGVLTTAVELQPCPEVSVYMALGMDMSKWEIVKDFLSMQKLATFAHHSIKLTPSGCAMAVKLDKLINK
jgi:hypothetical protein